MEDMIKLHQFAIEQGVSDRQVQRLIQKYGNEIEGMYERKGHNGTWLSEEACEILRSKMKTKSAELYDDSKDKEIARLNKELDELKESLKRKEAYIIGLEAGNKNHVERIAVLEAEQKQIVEKKAEEIDAAVNAKAAELEVKHREDTKKLQEHYDDELEERGTMHEQAIQSLNNKHNAAMTAEKNRKLSIGEAIKRVLGIKIVDDFVTNPMKTLSEASDPDVQKGSEGKL